jgi:hypothetical protein
MSRHFVCMFLLTFGTIHAQAQSMYPVVSKSEQRARDDDRRSVLESELAFEREAFVMAKSDFANGPTDARAAAAHRHNENIKALQRELGRIDNQSATANRERPVAKAFRSAGRVADPRKTANFWDPYNRASDTDDFSTSPRRESHE